ncbi:hypothetical protein F4778DRAFT_303119 [Xylariomycetidae sp. FL2044]|nr:hypothetical protein F4778DRAFT_303119 [Xylariomycetidae sp. FL2044]
MIRHPLNSAFGRARPDLNRVSEGIAASLRHFSVAQKLSSPDNDGPERPTGRQRAAAAVDELTSLNESSFSHRTAPNSTIQPSSHSTSPPMPNRGRGRYVTGANRPSGDGRPDVMRSVPGAPISQPNEGRAGPLGINAGEGTDTPAMSRPAVNIIRGGFRPRGRGGVGRMARGGGGARGGRGGRGGARGRGRGRGGRSSRGGRGGRRGREDGEKSRRDVEAMRDSNYTPEHVKAYFQAKEEGSTHDFKPSITLDALAGFGPAVASSTPFAHASTVVREARMLGGGNAFHPQLDISVAGARAGYRDGTGIFFPTPESKAIVSELAKHEFKGPPQEARTAVLETALLGKYDGPRYADPSDPVGTVRSYVKRDGTWNARGERGIEEKVKSLLPGGAAKAKPAGGAAAATTKA